MLGDDSLSSSQNVILTLANFGVVGLFLIFFGYVFARCDWIGALTSFDFGCINHAESREVKVLIGGGFGMTLVAILGAILRYWLMRGSFEE